MKTSAGVIAMGKGADVGVGKKTARKRAVGTREHIIAHLAKVSELFDANGMASTQLAAAVG
jgi:allantoicase